MACLSKNVLFFVKPFLLFSLITIGFISYLFQHIMLILANMSEVEKFTATKECSISGLQMNGGTVESAKVTNNG